MTAPTPAPSTTTLNLSPKQENALYQTVFGIIIAWALSLAWSHRDVRDDALISFRYAFNFANGNGLVYNIGERLEGYSNFLWTLILSVGEFFEFEMIAYTLCISFLIHCATLLIVYRFSSRLLTSKWLILLVLASVGLNYHVSVYASSGLETPLQIFLYTSVFYITHLLFEDQVNRKRLRNLGVLLALAFLNRMDVAILISICYCFVAFKIAKEEQDSLKDRIIHLLHLSIPLALICGGWLIWKWFYYGDIFPNTYYVKATGVPLYDQGLFYILRFFGSYPAFIFFSIVLTWQAIHRKNPLLTFFLCVYTARLLYTIKVGGDFMHGFRFLVLLIPTFFILSISSLPWGNLHTVRKIVIILMLLIGPWGNFGGITVDKNQAYRLPMFSPLTGSLPYEPDFGLLRKRHAQKDIGELFAKEFTGSDVLVAIARAGYFPYYSKLPIVDMYGLNDAWIAKHGKLEPKAAPGHRKKATIEYLQSRKVNLVLRFDSTPISNKARNYSYSAATGTLLRNRATPDNIPGTKFLEVPVRGVEYYTLLYLNTHPDVDAAIERNRWKVYPITE